MNCFYIGIDNLKETEKIVLNYLLFNRKIINLKDKDYMILFLQYLTFIHQKYYYDTNKYLIQKYFSMNKEAYKYEKEIISMLSCSEILKFYSYLTEKDNIVLIKNILLDIPNIKNKEIINFLPDKYIFSVLNHIFLIKKIKNPFFTILYRNSDFFYNKIVSFDFFRNSDIVFNSVFTNLNKNSFFVSYKNKKDCFFYKIFTMLKNFYLYYFSFLDNEKFKIDKDNELMKTLLDMSKEEIFFIFTAFFLYEKGKENNIDITFFSELIKKSFINNTGKQIYAIIDFLYNLEIFNNKNKKKKIEYFKNGKLFIN